MAHRIEIQPDSWRQVHDLVAQGGLVEEWSEADNAWLLSGTVIDPPDALRAQLAGVPLEGRRVVVLTNHPSAGG